MALTLHAAGGDLTAAIQRASALLTSDPAEAERLARQILARAPDDPRALLVLGSARRRQGDPAAARDVLEPLAAAYPQAAHTRYELGLAFADLGASKAAVAALRAAVAAKPDLGPAWRALGGLLFREGDVEGAESAYAREALAEVSDPALKPAAQALFDGRLQEAEQRLCRVLQARPADPAAWRMLGEALARLDRFEDAEAALARCLAIDPHQDGARFTYADVLFKAQKGRAALAEVEALLGRDAGEPAYRNLQAACLGLLGEHERAIGIYEALLAEHPRHARVWLNLGHALRTTRRVEAAIGAYRRCLELEPRLGEAWWGLANLKVGALGPADADAMAAALQRPGLGPDDRLHLHYALGKALEDGGLAAEAFGHYAEGARLRRAALAYDPEASSGLVRRAKALFSRPFLDARRGGGCAAPDPIFIVGLPRSGSTLIEQILASHPAVEGTMELPDLGFIARDLARTDPRGYPDVLAGLDARARSRLGELYLERTRVHRRLGRPLFIDKMPNNFHHIGLIQLILPRAKIIDARRHPMAACFSAFKQHFAQGQAFSYDLVDLGRYYRDYAGLMAHFDQVLPGRVRRVIYEDLVEDLESGVRALLDHCGLPFDERCLRYHENDRAVRTVSSEQVRRPIYRDSLDQWRQYEPWLGPLAEALGPALETWRT